MTDANAIAITASRPAAAAAARCPYARDRRREAAGAASADEAMTDMGIGRNGDAAASDKRQAGHDPADRAQQRAHAWMPHARHVDRPRRRRSVAGPAGEPQRSQKPYSVESADEAAHGPIIARADPSGRAAPGARRRKSMVLGECSACPRNAMRSSHGARGNRTRSRRPAQHGIERGAPVAQAAVTPAG